MPQLAVAAVGAYIGSAAITGTVLGMTGAAIGWTVGSMVGAALFKPGPTEGPRIDDKKVSTTTYGQPIPYMWGTDRMAAQFIWASDLKESSKRVGKSAFSSGAKVYSYSMDVLLCVCESPFDEPRYALRLWANGRLIGTWNGRYWEVDGDLIRRENLRSYTGGPDQLPDPAYELAVGVGNAPAYRGRLTIMLQDLQLEPFGNRAPNFEVEVTSVVRIEDCPTEPPVLTTISERPHYSGSGGSGRFAAAYDPERREYWVKDNSRSRAPFEVYKLTPGLPAELAWTSPDVGVSQYANVGGVAFDPVNRLVWAVVGYDGSQGPSYDRIGPVGVAISVDDYSARASMAQLSMTWENGGACLGPDGHVIACTTVYRQWADNPTDPDDSGGTGAIYGAMMRVWGESGEISWGIAGSAIINYRQSRLYHGSGNLWTANPCPACIYGGPSDGWGWHQPVNEGPPSLISDVLHVPASMYGTEINFQTQAVAGDTTVTAIIDDPNHSSAHPVPVALNLDEPGVAGASGVKGRLVHSALRKRVYVVVGDYVATIWPEQPSVFDKNFELRLAISNSVQHADYVLWAEDRDAMIVARDAAGNNLWIALIDPDSDEVLAGPCLYEFAYDDLPLVGLNYVGGGWFVALSRYNVQKLFMIKAPGSIAAGGCAPLGKIVSDIWLRSGGAASEIDVAELTDCVPGYTLARDLTGRGAIEPLRNAYFFDGVESGDKLRFPKLGKLHVALLDLGDLWARPFSAGENEAPAAYEMEHIEPLDVPREVTIKYLDQSADYDPGLQRAARHVGNSAIAPANIELPIVLDNDYAAQVAWTTLMRMHGAKNPVRFATTHAHAQLEPSDAVLLPAGNGEYQRIAITRRTDARPLIEFEGQLEDPAAWNKVAPSVARGQLPRQTQPLEAVVNSLLYVLDVPPLRAADNLPQQYLAVGQARSGRWPGAQIYQSLDGGTTYSATATMTAQPPAGILSAPLEPWTGGNRWDRRSVLSVNLRAGELETATELAVLAGANLAAVGNELIQWREATKVSSTGWELRGLLRYRYGTEHAGRTTHSAGTRFVVVDAAALTTSEYVAASIGSARMFKVPTFTQAVADAAPVGAEILGNAVRPLSPVHVLAGRELDGELLVQWARRARVNAAWMDLADVPLDEPTEAYRVTVWATAARTTVKRTEDVATPAWAYSAAQQTTDFGALQPVVHVSIAQLSPTYNIIGHAAEESL